MPKIHDPLPKNYEMKSIDIDKIATEVSTILFEIGAITFRPRQPFRYSSGILSPVYIDNRLLISYPNARRKIGNFFIKMVKEIGIPDVIAGVATAGIPHATFIAQKLNLPMVYVRSQPKNHGKVNRVEGFIKRGQKAIVIEDLASTGRSSIGVIEALRELGVTVSGEVAIYTYGLKEAEDNFKKAKVRFYALSDLDHSLQVSKRKGFLNEEQIQSVLSWAKDPKNWAKKMGFE